MELRVCKHRHGGEHGNERKTAVTREMVSGAERVRGYKHLIGIDALYVTCAAEGDTGGAETLPAVVASVDGNQIQLADTQLVWRTRTAPC